MSCFHGGDAEIMDLKTHLGTRPHAFGALGASRTPTHLRGASELWGFLLFFPATFTCNNLPQNRWKNSWRNLEIAPNCHF